MRTKQSSIVTSMIAGVVAVLPFIVLAQVGTTSPGNFLQERRDMRQQNMQGRQVLRTNIGDKMHTMQNDIRTGRDALKTEIKNLTKDEARKRMEEFRKVSQDKRQEMRQEVQAAREAFRDEVAARREALKAKIGEERAAHVEEYFDHMTDRMDAAIDRLDKLADRIESRLNKIHDAGKDITEPQAALDTARVAITAVHTAISDAKTKFSDLSKSGTPKEQFAAVKEIVNTVSTKSKEAHAALVEVINSIKRGRLDEATTTPSTP